jgi:hypothetical protein
LPPAVARKWQRKLRARIKWLRRPP